MFLLLFLLRLMFFIKLVQMHLHFRMCTQELNFNLVLGPNLLVLNNFVFVLVSVSISGTLLDYKEVGNIAQNAKNDVQMIN